MITTCETIDRAIRRVGNVPPILDALRQAVLGGVIDPELAERCLDAWETHRTANSHSFTPAAHIQSGSAEFIVGADGTYVEAQNGRISRDLSNSYWPDPTDLMVSRLNTWLAEHG